MLEEKIKSVIEEKIRPGLRMDGGDIEFISYDSNEGVVQVKLQGSCHSCPMAAYTLQMHVEALLRQAIPEIKKVVRVA